MPRMMRGLIDQQETLGSRVIVVPSANVNADNKNNAALSSSCNSNNSGNGNGIDVATEAETPIYRYAVTSGGTAYVSHAGDLERLDSLRFGTRGSRMLHRDLVVNNIRAVDVGSIADPVSRTRLLGLSDVQDEDAVEAARQVFDAYGIAYDGPGETGGELVRYSFSFCLDLSFQLVASPRVSYICDSTRIVD